MHRGPVAERPRRWALLLILLAGPGNLPAAPQVTGYERFHGNKPSAEGGAILHSELGCANCHGGGPGFPERRGPVLPGLANRVDADWVRAYLGDPHGTKPGTTMPHLLAGPDDPRIEPLLHYLFSLSAPGKPEKASGARHVNAERGSALYHGIGCVACHAPTADVRPPDGVPGGTEYSTLPVAFPDLGAKYSLASLSRFLEDTAKVRGDGRMPRFDLEPQEALDLAAHLLDFQDSDPRETRSLAVFRPDPDLVKAGEGVFGTLGCAACHDTGLKPAVRPLQGSGGGCLTGDADKEGTPDYRLTANQIASLSLYLESADAKVPSPPDRVEGTLAALNCVACHDRDGTGGPDPARTRFFTGDEALGDSGRLPPPLTGIGRKLQRDWLVGVLRGTNRVRPYLITRMPAYANHAEELAAMLAQADARPDLPSLAKGGEVEAGRKLLGIQGGVNCITCHRWEDRASLGIQALDLSNLGKRLQPEWLRDYLLNPATYRPGTLMPPLWPGGQSMIADVQGGDTELQLASIWAFIQSGQGVPDGYPDGTTGAFELVPQDRPIVQRTFLKGVGAHAILVGFPGGVNLAYDGMSGEPALLWRGRFFDAYSTWFVRAAPFEEPLGEDVLAWPRPAEGERRFTGYRLDASGNPVFLTEREGAALEERYEGGDGKLRRTITWNPADLAGEPLWTHPEGAVVAEVPGSRIGARQFDYQWKP